MAVLSFNSLITELCTLNRFGFNHFPDELLVCKIAVLILPDGVGHVPGVVGQVMLLKTEY